MSGENANAVLTKCAEEVIKRLLDAIVRELGYLFSYKTNIKNLKNQVVQLENLRQDVEIFLNEQSWNNAERAKSSAGWLKEVEEVSVVIKQTLEDQDKLGVWCVNLKNNRYGKSKKSTKLVADIRKLWDKAPKIDAIHQAPPAAMLPGAAANDASKEFISRTEIMDKVMEALKDDKINVIGICGLGGIGKTTLLHEVRERARTQKLFDAVAMTRVSQVVNVFEIQKNLADMLGLKTLEEVNDIIPRADMLQRRLKNGTNLIILDDIWSEIKLKDIGIPVGNGLAGCKVVLASRYETVCTSMRTQKTIPVDVLSKDEAWHMFKKTAGDCIEREKLEEIGKEIADKCGGLPIALVTLAGALFNKKKSSWEDARRQLRQSSATRITGISKDVYLPIMVSYKLLATHNLQEAQPLLLICCQYGEDYEIEVENLARYCLALKLFKDVDKLVEARNRTNKLIEDLKSYFLLQAVDVEEGMYEKVKMHDMVRDVCLSIVSEVKEEKDKVYMHIMSQDSGGGHELDTNNEVDYPKLKVLVVTDHYDGGLQDIRRLEELKVLEISESASNFDLQPALQVLKNLRMLCIEEQSLSEDMMAAIGNLSSLEILRFSGSKISSFPDQIRQLSNLKLLDLWSFAYESESKEGLIPSGILPQLNKLEVLCMGNYGLLGKGAGKDIENRESYGRITELDSLPDLTTLQIKLGDPNDLLELQSYRFENLKTFLLTVKINRFYQQSRLLVEKTIQFKDVVGMKWVLEAKIQFIVRSTLALLLENIDDWTDPLILKEFVSLNELELRECNQLEYIIPEGSLDKLRILKLMNMSNLRSLWMGPTPIDPLCLVNLREIEFIECEAIETIFPHTTAICLAQLQILTIRYCPKLVGIFSKGELGTTSSSAAEIKKEPLNDFIVLFPKLRILDLTWLPKLEGFYNLINPRVIMLPRLENLLCSGLDHIKQIVGGGVLELYNLVAYNWLHSVGENTQVSPLGGLKSIYLKRLQNLEHLFWQIPHGIHSFQNLEKLEVFECASLGYLFSSSNAHMLVNLQSLVVESCESMKEVIKMDEDYGVKKILFRFLSSVRLKDLENLSSFCSNVQQSIEFPSLEEVAIYNCTEMKTFCCGHLTAEKLQGVNLSGSIYDEDILVWKDDLNETVRLLNTRYIEESDHPERGVADEYAGRGTDEGTLKKSSMCLSVVSSSDASLTPDVESPSSPESEHNEELVNSSTPDVRKVALPHHIEFFPSVSIEQSLHSSTDSRVQPKAGKELFDMTLSGQDEDWKRSRTLIHGVYVKSEWKTTFEEILTAKPNFLSGFRLKIARVKTDVIESAIHSLQILRHRTALTILSEELAYINDSLNDLETSGLDTAWLKRGYQRAIIVIKEQEAVSAATKLAMLEREKMEDEAKLDASTARLDAFKAEYDALMHELEAGKEIFGGGFDLETCLGNGLLD